MDGGLKSEVSDKVREQVRFGERRLRETLTTTPDSDKVYLEHVHCLPSPSSMERRIGIDHKATSRQDLLATHVLRGKCPLSLLWAWAGGSVVGRAWHATTIQKG